MYCKYIFSYIYMSIFYHRSTFAQAEKRVQNRKNKEVCIQTCHIIFNFNFVTIYIVSTSIYCLENLPYMLNKLIYWHPQLYTNE